MLSGVDLHNTVADTNSFELCHEKINILHMQNKDADQLCGNREADERLCFRCLDSTIPLLPKYKMSSL